MVEIIYFPKKCPKCGKDMRTVTKMYISWYECRDEKCGATACVVRR